MSIYEFWSDPIGDAELARREQAQHTPQDAPNNLHQYKAALADYEQKINDLRRENERLRGAELQLATLRPKLADCESALIKEQAANERLRGLLAECVRAIEHAQNCDFDESIRFKCEQCQQVEAASEAAKETTK